MPIDIRCSECGSSHRVNNRLAGRRVNCPGCGVPLTVPEPAASPPDDADAALSGGADSLESGPLESGRPEAGPVAAAASSFAGASGQPAQQPPSSQTSTVLDELAEEDEELPRRKPREEDELDMTPMVDVTFLLLIFFMVTASFSLQKSIQMPRQQTDAPSTSAKQEDPKELEPVELEIDQYGGFLVLAPDWERETPGKQNLITALKEAAGDNPENMVLSIKVHEMAKLQSLVDGMDAGTIAGFTELQVTQVDGF